jgi:hypothetical protein
VTTTIAAKPGVLHFPPPPVGAPAPRLRAAIYLHELRAHRFDVAELLERALPRRFGRLAECLELRHALGDVEAHFFIHVALRPSEAEPQQPAPTVRHASSGVARITPATAST